MTSEPEHEFRPGDRVLCPVPPMLTLEPATVIENTRRKGPRGTRPYWVVFVRFDDPAIRHRTVSPKKLRRI